MPREPSPKERLQRAVECANPDRVPIALRLEYVAATWVGMNFSDFALNPAKASRAIEYAFDRIGGWDGVDAAWTLGTRWAELEPVKVLLPGVDLPPHLPHRVVEEPVMKPEDYDIAVKEGMYRLYSVLIGRLGRRFDADFEKDVFSRFTPIYRHWEEVKSAAVFRGGIVKLPLMQFSMCRTWRGLASDLLKLPEKVKEACDATWMDTVAMGEAQSRLVGCRYVFIPCGRASATFLSKRLFLKYFLPYLKSAVEKLVEDGFTPRLHCDTDWTPFLEYFLELPKKSCILEIGPPNSLAYAKKVLGGHMCVSGDIPQSLLVAGGPRSVTIYCKRLMDEVGRDGFILANNDIVPHNARFENVKALVEAGKMYG